VDLTTLLQRLDFERREVAWGEEDLEVLPQLTRRSGRGGEWHSVSYSSLTAETADAAIADELRRAGGEFEWKYYSHDSPEDLPARLLAHGLVPQDPEAVMVQSLGGSASVGHEVKPVNSLERLEIFQSIAERAFGRDQSRTVDELGAALESGSTQLQGFIAYVGDVPASVGRLYISADSWFAGLYGGGTLAEFRGRGLYRSVLAARMNVAASHGAPFALVDSLPTSQPILTRLGFFRLTETIPYTRAESG
jgi:hypothetical protein